MIWRNYMEWEKQEVMRVLAGRPGTIYQESTEQEKEQFRRWIKDVLQTGITTVEFIKSDGSLRTMKSTLDSVIIPITSHEAVITETIKRKTPENNEVCKVWDTEANAWRSFRYDRIKRISLELG
jgi:hypothetical protein